MAQVDISAAEAAILNQRVVSLVYRFIGSGNDAIARKKQLLELRTLVLKLNPNFFQDNFTTEEIAEFQVAFAAVSIPSAPQP